MLQMCLHLVHNTCIAPCLTPALWMGPQTRDGSEASSPLSCGSCQMHCQVWPAVLVQPAQQEVFSIYEMTMPFLIAPSNPKSLQILINHFAHLPPLNPLILPSQPIPCPTPLAQESSPALPRGHLYLACCGSDLGRSWLPQPETANMQANTHFHFHRCTGKYTVTHMHKYTCTHICTHTCTGILSYQLCTHK